MATGEQIDKAAEDMHEAVISLYVGRFRQADPADDDIQAAMLTGIIAGAAMLYWKGRRNSAATPSELAKWFERTALDFLEQYEISDRKIRSGAVHL